MFKPITLNGITYKARIVKLPNEGAVMIGTIALEKALFKDGDSSHEYVSDEAEEIDEEIFFYVEENELELPVNELIAIIQKSI
jgi:hypothetical protein